MMGMYASAWPGMTVAVGFGRHVMGRPWWRPRDDDNVRRAAGGAQTLVAPWRADLMAS